MDKKICRQTDAQTDALMLSTKLEPPATTKLCTFFENFPPKIDKNDFFCHIMSYFDILCYILLYLLNYRPAIVSNSSIKFFVFGHNSPPPSALVYSYIYVANTFAW